MQLYHDTRASTAIDDYKTRKVDKQKKAEQNAFGKPQKFDMSFIETEKANPIILNTDYIY